MPSTGDPFLFNADIIGFMQRSPMSMNLIDLHPDDLAARTWLRDHLLAERDRRGIVNRQIAAAVGHKDGWAYNIFATVSWKLETIQMMCRAMGYELRLELCGMTIAGTREPEWEAAYNRYMASDNPLRREEATRVDLGDMVRRVREASGLSRIDLGKLLNQEAKSVRDFEHGERPGYMLVSLQRYFRAMNMKLRPVLYTDDKLDFAARFEWPGVADELERAMVHETGGRILVWNTANPAAVVSFSAAAFGDGISRNV